MTENKEIVLNQKALKRLLKYFEEIKNETLKDFLSEYSKGYFKGTFNEKQGITIIAFNSNNMAVAQIIYSWDSLLDLTIVQDILFHSEHRVEDYEQ